MMRNAGLLVAAWLLLVPASLWAQGTYAIKLRDSVTGGVQREMTETIVDGTTTVKAAGANDQVVKLEMYQLASYRQETLDQQAGRPPNRLRRTYDKAQISINGKLVDLPYQGKTVLVEKKGGAYRFQVQGGNELTGEDAFSLRLEFTGYNGASSAVTAALLPRKAVAVGESWKVDLAGIDRFIEAGGPVGVDLSKATATGTLVRVYQKDSRQYGVMEFRVTVPLTSLRPSAASPITMKPGSVITGTLTVDGCIDGSRNDATVSVTAQMNCQGSVAANGMTVSLTTNAKVSARWVTSQENPSPPPPVPPQPSPADRTPVRTEQPPPQAPATPGTGPPSSESGTKDTNPGKALPWLLLSLIGGSPLVVLVLALLIGVRRRVRPASSAPITVKRRCVHCGKGVRVLSGKVGRRFQCPGCGTVQRIEA